MATCTARHIGRYPLKNLGANSTPLICFNMTSSFLHHPALHALYIVVQSYLIFLDEDLELMYKDFTCGGLDGHEEGKNMPVMKVL